MLDTEGKGGKENDHTPSRAWTIKILQRVIINGTAKVNQTPVYRKLCFINTRRTQHPSYILRQAMVTITVSEKRGLKLESQFTKKKKQAWEGICNLIALTSILNEIETNSIEKHYS